MKEFLRELGKNEEIVIENGCVYVKEKFNKLKWAKQILTNFFDARYINFHIDYRTKIIIAFQKDKQVKPGIAICQPGDKFNVTIGQTIALCKLLGIKIPKEIFE